MNNLNYINFYKNLLKFIIKKLFINKNDIKILNI